MKNIILAVVILFGVSSISGCAFFSDHLNAPNHVWNPDFNKADGGEGDDSSSGNSY